MGEEEQAFEGGVRSTRFSLSGRPVTPQVECERLKWILAYTYMYIHICIYIYIYMYVCMYREKETVRASDCEGERV